MGWFSNFAVSFTIISILTGGVTTFYLGMDAGGPRVSDLGWLFVGGMCCLVGAAMAEVCSATRPPAASTTGRPRWPSPREGAHLVVVHRLVQPGRPGRGDRVDRLRSRDLLRLLPDRSGSFAAKPWEILFRSTSIVLGLHGVLNTFGVKLVAMLNNISVWWHLDRRRRRGRAAVRAAVHHRRSRTRSQVQQHGLGWGFSGNVVWVGLVGLMLAQYTITGFDASAHMTEETQDAARSGPKGHHDLDLGVGRRRLHPDGRPVVRGPVRRRQRRLQHRWHGGRQPPGCIFLDSIGGTVAEFLMFVVIVAQFFCGDVVGDGQLADDLRVLPRRRDPRLEVLAPHQPAHPDAHELDLVRGGRRLHSRPSLALHPQGRARSPSSRSSRLPSSGSTSPTSSRCSCVASRASLHPRAVAAREQERRSSAGWPSSGSS